jgi:hypothetical protein
MRNRAPPSRLLWHAGATPTYPYSISLVDLSLCTCMRLQGDLIALVGGGRLEGKGRGRGLHSEVAGDGQWECVPRRLTPHQGLHRATHPLGPLASSSHQSTASFVPQVSVAPCLRAGVHVRVCDLAVLCES